MTEVVRDITSAMAETARGEVLRRVARPLIGQLARGAQVDVADLASRTGMQAAELGAALHAFPDVEWDATGRIRGFGITLQPPADVLEREGRTLHTWCAFDTLFFAALLDGSSVIRSGDPATRDPVRIENHDDSVSAVEPPTTVLSWVGGGGLGETTALRAAFCDNIRLFVSPERAAAWQAAHPWASLVSVADGYAAARGLASRWFA